MTDGIPWQDVLNGAYYEIQQVTSCGQFGELVGVSFRRHIRDQLTIMPTPGVRGHFSNSAKFVTYEPDTEACERHHKTRLCCNYRVLRRLKPAEIPDEIRPEREHIP